MSTDEPICVECGNDLATQGWEVCWDCLEQLNPTSPAELAYYIRELA